MDLKSVILNSEALAHEANAYDYFVGERSDVQDCVYMEPIMDSVAMSILGPEYDPDYTYKMITENDVTSIIAIDKDEKIVEDFKLEMSDDIMSYNEMWDKVSSVSYSRLDAVDNEIKHEFVPDRSQWPMYVVIGLLVIGLLVISVALFYL